MEGMQRTEGNNVQILAEIANGQKTDISQWTISPGNAHKQMTYKCEISSTVTLEAIP